MPTDRTAKSRSVGFGSAHQAQLSVEDQIIGRALEILSSRGREGAALTSPGAVRDYLRLALSGREHEVFVCIWVDAQHRAIALEEAARGTLTQTSVYPREIVKAALRHNAAAVIFAHNHPSGVAQPSPRKRDLGKRVDACRLDRPTAARRERGGHLLHAWR